jgi:hypothetical protein
MDARFTRRRLVIAGGAGAAAVIAGPDLISAASPRDHLATVGACQRAT